MTRWKAWVLGALVASGAAWALNSGLDAPPPNLARETPRQAVQGFLDAARSGQYARAAHFLYLDHLPRAEQAAAGARRARQLRLVLDRKLFLEPDNLSAEPEGSGQGRFETLGTLQLGERPQAVRLQRVRSTEGGLVWVFSQDTVRAVNRWYQDYGPPFGDRLPDWLFRPAFGTVELWQLFGLALVLTLATLVSLFVQAGITWLLFRATRFTQVSWDDELVRAGRGPLRLLLWTGLLAVGTRLLVLAPGTQSGIDVLLRSLSIAAVVWFLLRAVRVGADFLDRQVANGEVNARNKSLRTQFAVLKRVVEVVLTVVGAALVLLQFELVRNVGVSLLASAGIAGVVLGFAAQKSIGSLLAGIQLSITQPVRIGDTVIVEGQFGTVEEIRLTYVVVRTWDLRRLVVPINIFLEKTFENWTYSGANLLGAVLFEVDYTADVEAFRRKLKEVLEGEGRLLWDGQVQAVQVVDAVNQVVTLRALAGALDAGKNWDLRCLIRERFLELVRQNPSWAPLRRTETRGAVHVDTNGGLPRAPAP